jgi:uncharacterized damage-inducible protein DinB
MRNVLTAIQGEYRRYKKLGEGAFEQTNDDELVTEPAADGNSIAMIVWHVSGNLRSRFTDFLTTDGEKPWRDRESEFAPRQVSRAELLKKWEDGWSVLFSALSALDDSMLDRQVKIRDQLLTVLEALARSVTHTSYHVGQIVMLAKGFRGEGWKSLTIPRGGIPSRQ